MPSPARPDRIELHLHLEGAAPPAFIRGLAAEKSHELRGVFDADGAYAFTDFAHFLKTYEAATSVLQTPQDYYRLTRAVMETQAEHGILYTETFLSPQFCGGGDLSAWQDYLAAIKQAAQEAEAQDGVILRGIITAVRHFGPDHAKNSAACAQETAGDWLVGFGMGGNESIGEASDFSYAFDMAREADLCLTSHAGEWSGPQEIHDALDHLKVERIGHGVRAAEDPELMDRLAEAGTVLEVCPGSNIALGLFPTWTHHPIEKLRAHGVPVTVSTDDPPFFHTHMTREYEQLADAFGWDEAAFRAMNRVAAEAAFCDATTKKRLMKALETEDD